MPPPCGKLIGASLGDECNPEIDRQVWCPRRWEWRYNRQLATRAAFELRLGPRSRADHGVYRRWHSPESDPSSKWAESEREILVCIGGSVDFTPITVHCRCSHTELARYLYLAEPFGLEFSNGIAIVLSTFSSYALNRVDTEFAA